MTDAWDSREGQTHYERIDVLPVQHARGRLLGLRGRAGAGKSTIARALIADGSAVLLHLAGPLKSMMRALGFTEAEINGEAKQIAHPVLCGHTPRHAMQTLGTEWGRGCIGEELWINLAMREVDRLLAHGVDVILDDVRFVNEAAAIWERSGAVIQLAGRAPITSQAHASESELPDRWIHGRVSNTCTVDAVAAEVRRYWYATIAHEGASRDW